VLAQRRWTTGRTLSKVSLIDLNRALHAPVEARAGAPLLTLFNTSFLVCTTYEYFKGN